MRYHRSNTPSTANPAGTPNHLPGRTLSLRYSLPQCPTGRESEPPNSSPPSQPIQTWSSFHSASPTSHSKFFNKSFCVAPSRPSKARLPHGIKKCPPNGSQSPRFAAHGGRSPTPTPFSGPGSRQISTCPGLTSCNSAPSPYYSMSTFALVGEKSTTAK